MLWAGRGSNPRGQILPQTHIVWYNNPPISVIGYPPVWAVVSRPIKSYNNQNTMGAPYTLIKKLLKEQAYGSLLPSVECVPATDHAPLKTSIWYQREAEVWVGGVTQ